MSDLGADAVQVCQLDDLVPERGAAALIDGTQVAIFRLLDGTVRAVSQRDPFSGANVMSRGIVGTRQGEPTVAAPIYKQVFSLNTGVCLDRVGYEPHHGAEPDLQVWSASVVDGAVWVERVPATLSVGG